MQYQIHERVIASQDIPASTGLIRMGTTGEVIKVFGGTRAGSVEVFYVVHFNQFGETPVFTDQISSVQSESLQEH